MEVVHEVDQELLGAVLVLGELPDDVAVHDVLGGDAAHRALQSAADHDLAVDRHLLPLRLAA